MSASAASPPTTPPAIAPVLFGLESEDVLSRSWLVWSVVLLDVEVAPGLALEVVLDESFLAKRALTSSDHSTRSKPLYTTSWLVSVALPST